MFMNLQLRLLFLRGTKQRDIWAKLCVSTCRAWTIFSAGAVPVLRVDSGGSRRGGLHRGHRHTRYHRNVRVLSDSERPDAGRAVGGHDQ
jgi:hypothetical protein